MEMLKEIAYPVLTLILGVVAKFLVDFLSAKAKELKNKTESAIANKYINMIEQTITECVIATNQTYVNSLKQDGVFNAAAQQEAFNKTFNAVLAILSEDAKAYILETTGDVKTYLTTLIESAVNRNRK